MLDNLHSSNFNFCYERRSNGKKCVERNQRKESKKTKDPRKAETSMTIPHFLWWVKLPHLGNNCNQLIIRQLYAMAPGYPQNSPIILTLN